MDELEYRNEAVFPFGFLDVYLAHQINTKINKEQRSHFGPGRLGVAQQQQREEPLACIVA